MNAQVVQPTGWLQYLLPVAVIVIVFAYRLRRMSQERPLKLNQLWIVPALFAVMTVVSFVAAPPVGTGWLWCALALALGAGLGWQRGRAMRISVDPATGTLNQKASPAAMLFLIGLIAVRSLARYEAGAHGFNPLLVSGMLLSMALGLFSAMRAEMFVRGKRILAEARRPATSG